MWSWVWAGYLVVGLLIESIAIASEVPGATLSENIWRITTSYPLLPLGFGLLMGHFFWQRVVK